MCPGAASEAGARAVTPGIRSGKPCIKGTRIAVYDVLEYLAGGMSDDAIADLLERHRADLVRLDASADESLLAELAW